MAETKSYSCKYNYKFHVSNLNPRFFPGEPDKHVKIIANTISAIETVTVSNQLFFEIVTTAGLVYYCKPKNLPNRFYINFNLNFDYKYK